MIFVLICLDREGALQTRLDNRPAHVEYLDGLNDRGRLKFAGPFLGADGKPCGSMVAIAAETLEEAERIAANDPYARAGLFRSVEIRPWNWVFNNPGES